ncbi:MAG: 4-demethylwyosine synthase TYW1 [Candidatus Hermodarchaeota archaeon]
MSGEPVDFVVSTELAKVYRKQRYRFIGKNSVLKKCYHLHKALTQQRPCYKQTFYGTITTHRCMQLSPTFNCTQACLFCWRTMPGDEGIPITQEREIPDEPAEILDNAVIAQRKILDGYNPVCHPKVTPKMYEEARNPRHVAISLVGEPTLYERLSDLIQEIKHRGWTSYLVSNGTNPQVLKQIDEPTQLYISLVAPDKKTHQELCRPLVQGSWERLQESLDLFSTLSCPTVVRMTLVAGRNMQKVSQYGQMLVEAEPDYIECKSYMHVGGSMNRLSRGNMPSMKSIREFAEALAKETSYLVTNEDTVSRVVLLSKNP